MTEDSKSQDSQLAASRLLDPIGAVRVDNSEPLPTQSEIVAVRKLIAAALKHEKEFPFFEQIATHLPKLTNDYFSGRASHATSRALSLKRARAFGVGRDHGVVARVWIKNGSGKLVINGQECGRYSRHRSPQISNLAPFRYVALLRRYDIVCLVKGGEQYCPTGAVKSGIAQALLKF